MEKSRRKRLEAAYVALSGMGTREARLETKTT
jgi:hypothetical protein